MSQLCTVNCLSNKISFIFRKGTVIGEDNKMCIKGVFDTVGARHFEKSDQELVKNVRILTNAA